MQFISKFSFNHLPRRMEEYRDKFEHHWIIEMSDEGIDEAGIFFKISFVKMKAATLNAMKRLKKLFYTGLLLLVHWGVIIL